MTSDNDKKTDGGIVTNDLLESVPELEQAFGGGGREVASPELQNLQAPERQEGQGRGVPDGGRQHRDDLEGGEEAEDPAELLEGAVIAEVGDVCSEVVDGGASQEALELVQRLQPRLHVVEPRRVQLQHQRSLDQRPRLLLHELHQLLQVPISRHNRHFPNTRTGDPLPLRFTVELGLSRRSQQSSPTPWEPRQH